MYKPIHKTMTSRTISTNIVRPSIITKTLEDKINDILNEVLPSKAFRYVGLNERGFGGSYIKIAFAANEININNVSGQKPQLVSLTLNLDGMELYPQCFGGNGGQSIYRKPNLELREEKFLAMKSVKIPFRKPKPEEKFILVAIRQFAQNWLHALNANREVLMYQDLVNYDELLS